ncbi:MAG: DUF493 domain-containing protein [Wenzhouxiangellaceae bacterium]|nr:DUF493 domain-containing protein [Wenzhouxiangellaceae bacterium]
MDVKLDETGALEFPCRYPIKAMTHRQDRALDQVLGVLARHETDFERESVRLRPSRNGRFQSITVAVRAESRTHLETLYAELRALDVVVMLL